MSVLSRLVGTARATAAESAVLLGLFLVAVGVALIYYPAALIIGGLLFIVLGIGRLRA